NRARQVSVVRSRLRRRFFRMRTKSFMGRNLPGADASLPPSPRWGEGPGVRGMDCIARRATHSPLTLYPSPQRGEGGKGLLALRPGLGRTGDGLFHGGDAAGRAGRVLDQLALLQVQLPHRTDSGPLVVRDHDDRLAQCLLQLSEDVEDLLGRA